MLTAEVTFQIPTIHYHQLLASQNWCKGSDPLPSVARSTKMRPARDLSWLGSWVQFSTSPLLKKNYRTIQQVCRAKQHVTCNCLVTMDYSSKQLHSHSYVYILASELHSLWPPNRVGHHILQLWFLLSSFFSSPNLSGRRLDVYHTSTHDVASVWI